MRILVTGGAGFIGSWLVDFLEQRGDHVTVVDNMSPQIHGVNARLPPDKHECGQVEYVLGDVRDHKLMDKLLAQTQAVVHLAAETGTGQSMYRIAHYFEVNVQATAALFELIGAKHRHVRKFVLASSRSVYGEGAYRLNEQLFVPAPRQIASLEQSHWEPMGPGGEALELCATPENAPTCPASIYAATKQSAEEIGRICSDAFGIQVMALRFQNVYGERQSLKNPYTGILSIFSNKLRFDSPINVFEDGKESRDFVHVSDAVNAIVSSLDADLPGYHVVNIGSGVPTSVLAITEALAQLLQSKSKIRITGDYRAGDIRHCYADITRAKSLLGFSPKVSLGEGLAAFCKWVLTQEAQPDHSERAQHELQVLGLGKGRS